MSKLLTREEILAANDLITESVSVPEWGGAVLVRTLTAAERDAFEASCYIGRGQDRKENFVNLRARMVALSIVDATGAKPFSGDDVKALGEKSGAALDRVYAVAQRLTGFG